MKFRSGIKRAEMANAIDQYVSDTVGEVRKVTLGNGSFEKNAPFSFKFSICGH